MAKKYIDAERFVEYFGDWYTEEGTEIGFVGPIKDLVFLMPAADVVEVVRCKDCKHWSANTGLPFMSCDKGIINSALNKGLAYCSYGERKDG